MSDFSFPSRFDPSSLSHTGLSSSQTPQTSQGHAAPGRQLRRRVAEFQEPILGQSVTQLVTSAGAFLAVCAAMYLSAEVSYWISLALAPLASGFLVRTFIVQHDCGHGSFFRTRWLNSVIGHLCSAITWTPYSSWHRQHAGHHGVWNNLDRRDTGADFYSTCVTVEEYRAMGPLRRAWHRVTRHPLFANVLLPPFVFLVLYRVPFDMPKTWRRERWGVYLTNLMLGGLAVGLAFAVGLDRIAEIQLPIIVLASIAGVWLFTIQHRSERTVWRRGDNWSALSASLDGATHLRLPRVLKWFTGNIGLHHVHHLDPRIPNYRLQECHDAVAELHSVPVLTLSTAMKSMSCALWDEKHQRWVNYRAAEASPRINTT